MDTKRGETTLIFQISCSFSKTWSMTLLLHLKVQSPTHHLSSSSFSLKYTCDLSFHLPLLAPLSFSLCAAGSPPPSLHQSPFLSISLKPPPLSLYLSHHLKMQLSSGTNIFQIYCLPALLRSLSFPLPICCNTFSFNPPLVSLLYFSSVHLSLPLELSFPCICLSSDAALILTSFPRYKHDTHSTNAHAF